MGYGGLDGLAEATLVVTLMALLSGTIKTVEDMEKVTSLECFAVLPETKQKARKNSKASRYISVLDPRSTHGFRESIRSLTSRLENAMKEKKEKNPFWLPAAWQVRENPRWLSIWPNSWRKMGTMCCL